MCRRRRSPSSAWGSPGARTSTRWAWKRLNVRCVRRSNRRSGRFPLGSSPPGLSPSLAAQPFGRRPLCGTRWCQGHRLGLVMTYRPPSPLGPGAGRRGHRRRDWLDECRRRQWQVHRHGRGVGLVPWRRWQRGLARAGGAPRSPRRSRRPGSGHHADRSRGHRTGSLTRRTHAQRSHRRGLRRRPGPRRGPVCTLRRVGTWRRRRNGPSGPGRDCARGVHPRDADSSRTRCADRVGRVSCM